MRSHFLSVNGLTLHVVEYGGEGPPLLAVHGTGMVAQTWGVMAPYLTPHFRVYALDRRGHGESDKPEGGYQLEQNVADYVGVVERFGGEWVALGHSSGGTSLGIAAARRPGLFRRVAMVDPIIFGRRPQAVAGTPPTDGARNMAERTRRRRAEWPSAEAMFESLVSKPPFDTWQPAALWDYVRYGTEEREDGSVVLKCPPALEAQMYGHASDVDLFAEFEQIGVPVLIIRGERTDRFPRESAERAVASMRDARLVEMAGLTHFPSMEAPEAVGPLVVEFLMGGGARRAQGRAR